MVCARVRKSGQSEPGMAANIYRPSRRRVWFRSTKRPPRRARFAACVVAVGAGACGAVALLITLPPISSDAAMKWLWAPAFFAILPVWGVVRRESRDQPPRSDGLWCRRGFPPLEKWRAVVGGVLLTVAVAAFLFAALRTPAGAPLVDGGRYFITSGGDRVEVSRAEWLSARTRETRMFAGGVVLFATVAVLYLTQTMNRSASSLHAGPTN